MRLTVLGCQGPYPGPGGATSGYLLETAGGSLALDLGSGCLAELTRYIAPEALTALVFSHWHHDHCTDALPLLYRLQARGAALDVWGPEDESSPVFSQLRREPCIRLHILSPGQTVALGGEGGKDEITLRTWAARHPAPALLLRLTAEGKTLCYTGDSNTTPPLAEFARDADLLLADGLFPERLWGEGKPHLSARLTAELAREAGAKRLVITHLNPDLDPEELLREARAVEPGAILAEKGLRLTL